ncbi:hypothetical protein RvY_01157 [Ramazzottius varieornatus]|uniref:ETS domain-containing protein n=1 Tax=Ramazzottius varieornatus TaxID=947166 RepID=A0A1D1ULD9_RAMVA|nr:hypothetical protein RvY_01157 [Ramazzottius varieornatus]
MSPAVKTDLAETEQEPNGDSGKKKQNGSSKKRPVEEAEGSPRSSASSSSSLSDPQAETSSEPELNKRRKSAQPHKAVVDGQNETPDEKPDIPELRATLPPLQPRTNASPPSTANKGLTSMAASNGSGSEEAYHHHFDLEVNLDEPVSNLVKVIQRSLNFDLAQATILLCGLQKLTRDMCLKDCTKDGSSGMAKVKLVATNNPKDKPVINIVDVLQPLAEKSLAIKRERTPSPDTPSAPVSPTIELQKSKIRSRSTKKRGISYPRPTAKGITKPQESPDGTEWDTPQAVPAANENTPATLRPRTKKLFAKETPGSIQLWQFLLDLLVSGEEHESIQWFGEPGEFRLLNPERVAVLWGQRKKKASMNYEKMSRALRYYYDGDILGKVPGKHFTYKFVCDLKEATGYSAEDLAGARGSSGSASCPSSPATSVGHESLAESDGSLDLSVRSTGKKSRKVASLAGALDLRHMQERLSSA